MSTECEELILSTPLIVKDYQLSASSEHSGNAAHGAQRSRLDTVADAGGFGGWTAEQSDYAPWIMVDFLQPLKVSGVVTQGREDSDQWVTKYTVQSSDALCQQFYDVTDEHGAIMVKQLIVIVKTSYL